MGGFKHYTDGDNDLQKYFVRDDGTLWQVTGYITTPAVCLKRIDPPVAWDDYDPETRTEVIGCVNSMRFTRMAPETSNE